MQGKTHRVGGVLAALTGYAILESKGMLVGNVNNLLQLAIIYPFAVYGSTLPDLDHNWDSAPSKDVVSFCINKILHLGKGLQKIGLKKVGYFVDSKHRSWQTHAIEWLVGLIFALYFLIHCYDGSADYMILQLILTGLTLGVFSHLLLDALTPQGIWLLLPSIVLRRRITFRLVPKSKFFATGGNWESLVRTIMWLLIALLILRVVYLLSPYRISFN